MPATSAGMTVEYGRNQWPSFNSAAKRATACGSIGTCRSRWTTALFCAPTSSGRPSPANIRSFLRMALTPRASPSRKAIRAPGRRWRPSIRTSPKARAISTRTGKWSIRRNGCRAITPACASTRAAAAAHPASLIISRRARPRTSTTASNGPACRTGRTARSASTASHIMASISGRSPRYSRRTLLPCAYGKAPPTGTAT